MAVTTLNPGQTIDYLYANYIFLFILYIYIIISTIFIPVTVYYLEFYIFVYDTFDVIIGSSWRLCSTNRHS